LSTEKSDKVGAIKIAIADVAGVSGCGLVVYGIMLVNIPAAFIVGGLFLMGGAWMLAR